jgi:hypothetical protein
MILPGGTSGYPAQPRLIRLSVRPSVRPSVCLSVCPSEHACRLGIERKMAQAQQIRSIILQNHERVLAIHCCLPGVTSTPTGTHLDFSLALHCLLLLLSISPPLLRVVVVQQLGGRGEPRRGNDATRFTIHDHPHAQMPLLK